MKILTGPLIIIAAALVWCGSGFFFMSARHDADGLSITGSLVAAALLAYGMHTTWHDRKRNL